MLRDYRGGEGITLNVRVIPRASRSGIAGVFKESLHVRVTSPPVGGEATRQALEKVAGFFHIPRSRVRLLRGEKSRDKLLLLIGIPRARAEGIISQLRSETSE